MAETSYPFSQSNSSGGTADVGQGEWQNMSRMWGGDRIDFQLTATSYSTGTLPFPITLVNNRDYAIGPGAAWVGGFYYINDSSLTLSIDPNLSAQGRIDTIVLRADLTVGSVNLTVVKGQPSASPVAPRPQRNPGGQWEMVLHQVTVPANNGALSQADRFQMDTPPHVAVPWNMVDVMKNAMPVGSFAVDMDSNGGDSQNEAFLGRDGYVVTRHFGKSRTYTPSFIQSATQPSKRSGRWRYIAPNVVWFQATLQSTVSSDIQRSGTNFQFGVTLPVPANGQGTQVLQGFVDNDPQHGSPLLPNYMSITGVIPAGNAQSNAFLYYPNASTVTQGLDGFARLPGLATLSISGVYEADAFSE